MDDEAELGIAVLKRSEIEKLQHDSSSLFTGSKYSSMAPDDGVITRRRVTLYKNSKKTMPFIEWFFEKVITTSLRRDLLSDKERLFMLTGRAGQGKSTLCRKLYLLLTDQERGVKASIQPNFDTALDDKMQEFFTEIQASTIYVQARKLSSNVGEHLENETRKFFIIDGIDEIRSAEVLKNIARLISTHKQSVFLISSRTRQGDTLSFEDEIINKDALDLSLNNVHVESVPEQNIAELGDLSKFEKSEMYKLLDEAEDLQSSRLEKLVKNDSPLLRRPADFHILKGDIKNRVQYYLGTTRWLLLRELNKTTERKNMVNSLSFTHLENGIFDFPSNKYFLTAEGKNETQYNDFIDSMKVFNLIESSSKKYYLDLTSPSSLGLLVCMYNDIGAQEFLSEEYRPKLSGLQFFKPKKQLWCSQLKDIFEQVIRSPLDKDGRKTPLYRFATSLLHSSQVEYKHEILDSLYSRLNPIEEDIPFQMRVENFFHSTPITDLDEKIQLLLFATDVLHPVDEMELNSVTEDFNPKHRRIIEQTIERELSQFGNDEQALNWWETRFKAWTKLYLNLIKIGPGSQFSDLIAEGGVFKNLDMETQMYKIPYIHSWYPFLMKMLTHLQTQTGNNANGIIDKYFEGYLLKQKSEKKVLNVSVRKRMFQSLCYVLGTHLGIQSATAYSQIGKSNKLKSSMIQLFIHECRFPDNIKIDALLDHDSKDVISSWWNLNGTLASENTKKVVEHFVNDAMNEKTIYLPSCRSNHIIPFDAPMRGSKFLNQIVQRTHSTYIKSILKGIVMSSRLAHMNPRNNSGMYNSTFGADIGHYLFAYSDGTSILDAFLDNQKNLLELSVEHLHAPPAVTSRKHKRIKVQERLTSLYNFAKERSMREEEESPLLRFAEFGTGSREQIRDSIHFWIKRGDFFVALLLSIRNGMPDLASVLLICETNGAHFYELKPKYIGNFVQRIPVQSTFVNSPENRDQFTNLLLLDSQKSNKDKKIYLRNIRKITEKSFHSVMLNVQFPGEKIRPVEVSDWIRNNEKRPINHPFETNSSFDNPNIFFFCDKLYFLEYNKWKLFKSKTHRGAYTFIDSQEYLNQNFDEETVHKINQRSSFTLLQRLVPAAHAPVFFIPIYSGNRTEGFEIDWEKSAFGTPEEVASHRFIINPNYRSLQIEMEYKTPDGDWRTAWSFESFGIDEPVISLETYNQNIVPQILRFRQMRIHSNKDKNHKEIIEQYCRKIKTHGASSPTNLHYFEKQEEQTLRAWHVPVEYQNPSEISNDDRLGFIQHLYQDELLLSGISTRIENVNDKIRLWDNFELYKWSRLSASKFTGGIQGLKSRDQIEVEDSKPKIRKTTTATLDMELSPPTCRSLMPIFEDLMSPKPLPQSLEEVELAGSKMSSLNYAHSRLDSNFIDDKNNRISHFKSFVRAGYDNYIYGHKLKFEDDGDGIEVEGIAELSREQFSGKDPRTVVSSFIPIQQNFHENNFAASPGWVESLKKSESLDEHLKNTAQAHQNNSGMRTIRTWGIITDNGEIDDFKIKRIYQKLQSIEENLQEFKSGLHVKNGRTNLIDFIRTVHSTFSYIDWLPNYQKALVEIKKRTISLLEQIQNEELLQRGIISVGTSQDFDTILSIIEGLENQNKRFTEHKIEQLKELVELLKSEKPNPRDLKNWKLELKKLAAYFGMKTYAKYHRQIQDALMTNAKLSVIERNDLLRYSNRRRGLKIRVLGLSKYNYPSEIDSDWSEVLGGLSSSDSIEIGSLVRFDIKLSWKAGVKSLLLTNILLAREELNPEGTRLKSLVPSQDIPKPLPKNTWLGMYTDKAKVLEDEYPSFSIKMFVKPGKLYAFHPSFDVEVPIFNTGEEEADCIGQMKQCKIEIRRDRRKGIFRYYVVEIKP